MPVSAGWAETRPAGPTTGQLKNNGYLDPGNPDIRDVLVELRFKGHLVAPADTLCTSERNSFSLAEVTKALASRRKS